MEVIPVHIINLKKRVERREHALSEFSKYPEFDANIIEAIECDEGAIGLWLTIVKILKEGRLFRDSCILICEDDHEFTNDYSTDLLLKAIDYVTDKKGDILFAGVSWLNNAVPVTDHIYWVEKSSGTQFMIIFKDFFDAILNASFTAFDSADTKISVLSDKKYFISPFLSIQKEFGYSDVTPRNSVIGRVDNLFETSLRKTQIISYLYQFYRKIPLDKPSKEAEFAKPLQVFVLNQSLVDESNSMTIFDQNDFSIDYIQSPHESVFNLVNLKNAIEKGKDNDVIIICRHDTCLTSSYSTKVFLEYISSAKKLSAELLVGGAEDFEIAVPITEHLFWINFFSNTSLIVLFRNAYDKILNLKPGDLVTEELDVSAALSNKLLIHPYITDFKHVDDVDVNPTRLSLMSHKSSSDRLELIRNYALSRPIYHS